MMYPPLWLWNSDFDDIFTNGSDRGLFVTKRADTDGTAQSIEEPDATCGNHPFHPTQTIAMPPTHGDETNG